MSGVFDLKIGILTFHRAHNYGAVLQAYALQTHLKQMGHEAEIIDYRPAYIENAYSFWPTLTGKSLFRKIKSLIYFGLVAYKKLKRWRVFEEFINNRFCLSKKIYKAPFNENFDYDVYVLGSDQIWNPKITNGYDLVFTGGFLVSPKAKKIAYAASKESENLNASAMAFFKKNLLNFEGVSVRESVLANLLQPLTEKHIETVLDPTLLVDCQIWYDMAKRPQVDCKYVLLYQMRDNSHAVRIAKHVAEQLGAKVVHLEARLRLFPDKNSYQNSSPEEFLGWIKSAECVITTSYHGVAFSIAFSKPFYTLRLNDGADSRAASLLSELSLTERILKVEDCPKFEVIDYAIVNQNLVCLRDRCRRFLVKHLNGGTHENS